VIVIQIKMENVSKIDFVAPKKRRGKMDTGELAIPMRNLFNKKTDGLGAISFHIPALGVENILKMNWFSEVKNV